MIRGGATGVRLGLGSYALAWAIGVPGYVPEHPLNVFGFVEAAAEHGFKLVQIADNLPLHRLSKGDHERLRYTMHERGVDVEVGARGLENGNLVRYVELARFFRSPILRIVVDSDTFHPEPEDVIRLIRGVLPRCEQANVTLAIENHDSLRAHELLDIVTTLDSPYVGVCLDTVNSFGALEGPDMVIDTLAPHVVTLHVKDFDVVRLEHKMGFAITGTPAGKGKLDVPRLLTRLNAEVRGISVILEQWPSPEATLAETVKKERRWLVESAAYLHAL